MSKNNEYPNGVVFGGYMREIAEDPRYTGDAGPCANAVLVNPSMNPKWGPVKVKVKAWGRKAKQMLELADSEDAPLVMTEAHFGTSRGYSDYLIINKLYILDEEVADGDDD